MGPTPRRTAFRSPWQNGIAERWVGSVRRELLDHVIVLNEGHLRRLLREYVDYYNEDRVHTVLRDSPIGRPTECRPSPGAQVVGIPKVGNRNAAVLVWGGLRGGVALALALVCTFFLISSSGSMAYPSFGR